MVDYDVVLIGDKKYIEIDRIDVDSNTFVYLVEIEESNHFVIRKYVKISDKEYFDGLENDKEYDIALSHFLKKHKNLI